MTPGSGDISSMFALSHVRGAGDGLRVEVVYTLQARRWFARLRFRSVGYSDGTTLTLSHYHMV